MLDFLFHRKRDEVKRLLHARVNRAHARTISLNNRRTATRGSFTEVVWVLPCPSIAKADYDRIFPAVMQDMSAEGIGIVHSAPITEPHAIVGLRDQSEPWFLACRPKHSTPLGYGFFHIGLYVEEIIHPHPEAIDAMCNALEKYATADEGQGALAPAR